jgi:tetratricopeptide (TPR) repeat protein
MRRLPATFLLFSLLLAAETTAILPFGNTSTNSSLDWIGESIAEALAEALSAEGLLIVDHGRRDEAYRRLALRPYADITRASVIKIGEQLDVDSLIYGQFQTTPGEAGGRPSLRITMRVLDLRRLRQSPEFENQGRLDDLSALQSQLAWRAMKHLTPGSALSEEEFRRRRNPVRVDAMENYIRGLRAASAEQKYRLLSQAARLDPNYWQPSLRLGLMQLEKKDWRVAADWLKRVPPSAVRYREAAFYLGICRFQLADYSAAQAAFRAVLDTIPLNEVHNNLGAAQSRAGLPEALDNFRKALEGDSSDPAYHFNVAYALWKNGEYTAAADGFRAVLDRVPNDQDATLLLGKCISKAGPRPGDRRTEGLERLKTTYEEGVYLQLKSLVEKGR